MRTSVVSPLNAQLEQVIEEEDEEDNNSKIKIQEDAPLVTTRNSVKI